jgi:FkbM family methyltransferase
MPVSVAAENARPPFWMRALRLLSLSAPSLRGRSRLLWWGFTHWQPPELSIDTTLDRTIGVQLQLNRWVDSNIYCLGTYEAPIVRWFMKAIGPDSVVFDVGAYIGQYALLAAKYAPGGKVLALEPNPDSYARLSHHVQANRFGRISCRPEAIGGQAGDAILELAGDPSTSSLLDGSSTQRGPAERQICVPVTTLDTLAARFAPQRIDVVKLDVEGMVTAALYGGQEVLSSLRPRLLMEVDAAAEACHGGSAESIHRALTHNGYLCYRFPRLARIEKDQPLQGNILALPARE